MEIRNRVVILTGASSGIGLASAHALARAGARLALVSRSAHILGPLAEQLRSEGGDAQSFPTDLRDRGAIERMVAVVDEHFGGVDVLVNNAGQGAIGALATLDWRDFQAIFELNVLAPLHAMQSVVPRMRKRGGGVIVNVSSAVAYMSIPSIGAYAATKAALDALTHTARVELAEDRIRFVTLYPGRVETELAARSRGSREERDKARLMEAGSRRNFGRSTPDEVADALVRAIEREPRDAFMNPGQAAFAKAAMIAPRVIERMLSRGTRARRSSARA